MSTLPVKAKENGEERTPVQNRLLPPPMTAGRSFGTPLSNCSSAVRNVATTSKKTQLRQSSSSTTSSSTKKIVRARKLVQQHRTPIAVASTSFTSSFTSPSAPTPPVDNTTSTCYVVTFLPGSMGFQLEPTQGNQGCRVFSFVDGGPENPGQARRSNQIQPGDIVLEINDEAVSHMNYDDIVDRLKALAEMPRRVLFRRRGSMATAVVPNMAPQTAPKPIRTFNLNSQGALTPVVSPPTEKEDEMSNEKRSVSSVLFMDPSQTPTAKTAPSSVRPGSAASSPAPPSPAYQSLPQDSLASGDIVLDINDDDRSQSIDTSSTISPSKVKNLSQEDLELGLGRIIGATSGGNKPNGSMAMVLRNVYNSVVGKKAVHLDFNRSVLPSKLVGSQNRIIEEVATVRNLPTEEASPKRATVVIEQDDGLEEEKKDEALFSHLKNSTGGPQEKYQKALNEAQNKETNRLEWLERQLTEANGRAEELQARLDSKHAANGREEELQARLDSKQAEMQRRVQETQEEANARVHDISELHLVTQANLERELQEANAKIGQLIKEKEESQAALEEIKQQLKDIKTKTESQKSTQIEAQLTVAKLQTELREEKKEVERLKSDVSVSKEQQQHAEDRLKTAETELQEKQDELDGTKCMMETYEEKFMERETDMELLTEEKDFAGRELAFARSELQRMQTALQQRDSDLEATRSERNEMSEKVEHLGKSLQLQQIELNATKLELSNNVQHLKAELQDRESDLDVTRNEMSQNVQQLQATLQARESELVALKNETSERAKSAETLIQSLREGINMATKELEETQQQGYDRERDLQVQLSQAQTELAKMQNDAAEKEQSLAEALEQRDADLEVLNRAIDTKIVTLNSQLQVKDDALASLAEAESNFQNAKAENQKLLQQQQANANEQAHALSQLKATVVKFEEELASKSKELESTKEALTSTQQAKGTLEKEAKELKDAANEIYQEKSRITKELQTAKFDISDLRLKATKTQDALLQRAKQMDGKAKESQALLKKKENEEQALLGRLGRAQHKIESLSADLEEKEAAIESSTSEIKSLEEKQEAQYRRELQLKVDLEEKEREKQGFQADLRDTKSTLFETSSRISFLERQLNECEAQRTIAEKENGTLKDEIETLTAKVESQRESLDQTSWELSTRGGEVMNLETALENAREDLKQRAEELDAMQKSLDTANTQYTQLSDCYLKAAAESSSKIQGLTADLVMAQDELADNVTNHSKLERQIASCKQQLQDGEVLSSELRAQLEVETAKSAELANINETQRSDSETKKAELQEELEKHRALTQKLEEECQNRTTDNADLVVELAGLEKKLSNTRTFVSKQEAEHKKERAELEEAHSSQKLKLDELAEKLNGATLELGNVRKQLNDTEIRYEDQLVIMRNTTSTKDSKLTELLEEREQSAKALLDFQDELSLAKLEIQRIEESRKRSREEVSSLTSLMDSLQSEHNSQQEALIQKHNEETATLLKDKEQVDSSIRKLQEIKLTLQKRIQDLEKVVEEEREKNECLNLEQDALTANLHRAEDMVADLNCQLIILKEEQANESIDSIDSQTLILSKAELRMKCKYLAEEVQEAEMRAASGTSTVASKQSIIKRMEDDVAEMSAELGKMIETSEQLEAALLKARMDKATSDSDAEALRTNIDLLEAKKKALNSELSERNNEVSELLDTVSELEAILKTSKEREESLDLDLQKSKQTLELLSEENNEDKNVVARISQELATANEKRESSLARISDLESELSKLEYELVIMEEEKELLRSEAQASRERFEEQLREMRNESGGLRSTIVSLESEVENHLKTIRSLEENKIEEHDKLEAARKYGLKMETSREEVVAKLAEASRVLAAQKGIISVHEARATEAEGKAKRLSKEVSALKESLQKLESACEENGMFRSSQLEELENKRTLLERVRAKEKADAEAVRDELRSTQRKASEVERINKSQETRIHELKSAAEATKAQLREARGAWTESENLSRSLENAVQQTKAENDSLRAKLMLSGATIARLRSDRALLEEAAQQVAFKSKNGDSSALMKELSQLHAELHTKGSQLSTVSTSLRNYKKMVSGMKTTEVSLVAFIEEIMVEAKATFDELSRLSSALKELSPNKSIQATQLETNLTPLDLATPGTPEKVFEDASCCLGKVVSLIKDASVSLEGKRRKLDTWRAQSNLHATTPQSSKAVAPAALLTPNETTAFRSFRRMKEVVENHVSKSLTEETRQQIHAVIVSLEGQIDSLCSELKAANVALQDKDKGFTELQAKIYALEHHSKTPHDSGKLSAIQETAEDDKEKMKVACVRSLAKVLENKTKAKTASGLRQWQSAAAAMHATDQQKHAAEALSKTLETTREKLVMLKMQHRRSKAGSNSHS